MRQFSTAATIDHSRAISGRVKVEYAFETARVRLYLPQLGETWFFVDRKTTLGQFKE